MARLDEQSSAYEAAAQGWIDDVIDPAETRDAIRQALAAAADSRQPGFKHRIDP